MSRRRVVIALLLLAAVIISVRFLPINEWLRQFQAYVVDIGPIGYVVFALVYAVACLVPSPAPTILTGLAGATFGLIRGSAVVLIGATIGAAAAFTLARTVLRTRVEEKARNNAKFRALDRAIGREGGKIVFLTRLSPVFPFTYINYAFGLTAVRPLPYLIATLAGIVPGTVAFVYIGAAVATAATGETDKVKLTLQIVGAIATLAVSVFVARLAKKEIAKSTDDGDESTAPDVTRGAAPSSHP